VILYTRSRGVGRWALGVGSDWVLRYTYCSERDRSLYLFVDAKETKLTLKALVEEVRSLARQVRISDENVKLGFVVLAGGGGVVFLYNEKKMAAMELTRKADMAALAAQTAAARVEDKKDANVKFIITAALASFSVVMSVYGQMSNK
jgi:hypothetical protein